jgi:hypothetical protein
MFLKSNGLRGDFDMVWLDATLQPASVPMMGLGLVGIAAVLGRRGHELWCGSILLLISGARRETVST